MRELQDNFYNKVGIKTGLTRLGPGGRRRLTRAKSGKRKQRSQSLGNRELLPLLAIVLDSKSQGRSYRDRRPSPEKAKGLGVKMSSWFAEVLLVVGTSQAPQQS